MYKKTLQYIALAFLVLVPQFAFAADMIVSGFGDSAANGVYVETGTLNGYPNYVGPTYSLCHMNMSHSWEFSVDGLCIDGSGTGPVYYSDDAVGTPDMVTTWLDNGGGLPFGTVVAGGSSSSTTPAVSTTTIIDANRDFANLLFLFTAWVFGIYWMFSKKR